MDPLTAQKAGKSLADMYEPGVKVIQKELNELTLKQGTVLKDMERENLKFSSINSNELNSLFMMIKEYQYRVHQVKEDMMELSEHSSKLKKRALRLQHHKQKEALEMAHYREAQLKREQDLIAKPDPNFTLP